MAKNFGRASGVGIGLHTNGNALTVGSTPMIKVARHPAGREAVGTHDPTEFLRGWRTTRELHQPRHDHDAVETHVDERAEKWVDFYWVAFDQMSAIRPERAVFPAHSLLLPCCLPCSHVAKVVHGGSENGVSARSADVVRSEMLA